jgi:hypothetical protein
MKTTIRTLSQKEVKEFRKNSLVKTRLGKLMTKIFEQKGWTIGDFQIEQKYKDYVLVIEFCIGDFCSYIGSKNNGWLLEHKVANESLSDALVMIEKYKQRLAITVARSGGVKEH